MDLTGDELLSPADQVYYVAVRSHLIFPPHQPPFIINCGTFCVAAGGLMVQCIYKQSY